MKYNEENLNSELSKLMAENAESQQRIKDLEDDIKVLTDKEEGEDNELGRQVFLYIQGSILSIFIPFSVKLKSPFTLQAEGTTEENLRSNET